MRMEFYWDEAPRLRDRLISLGQAVQQRIMIRAVDAAANVLVSPLRAAAPIGPTGNLRASIGKEIRRYSTAAFGIVGPQYPRGAHGHIVERGSKTRYAGTRGKGHYRVPAHRGRMPAIYFIAGVYNANRAAMVAVLRSVLQAEIEQEVGK